MSKITRSDVYVRDEKGGAWFDEFLHSFAGEKESSVYDVINAIHDKKADTVQSVVDDYRKQVGLDSLANDDDDGLKTVASTNKISLSMRHSYLLSTADVVSDIEDNPKLKEDIRSLCEYSGGNKGTHSIINYLRNELGTEVVKYSNDDLVKYIEEVKGEYRDDHDDDQVSAGEVGIDVDDNNSEDNIADYITHGKGGM